ncbi:fumarylacetoacetate hydrolase family protein [Pseudarthrobacter sp. R1]|uniref:fumarylacetoacetate hydrolase family protein n=1 Tax=Pseudarthrobacter sp. R1 TaxID=2944934 RepID=UPI0021094825|nr:fumarylacetoacetate hydrolase family protein [Pseudarthrobacter sp. R1]MCQ6269482.1 fumarylacetoacetate hydrolase family protein [Pseudarthrobacter sp. R1]
MRYAHVEHEGRRFAAVEVDGGWVELDGDLDQVFAGKPVATKPGAAVVATPRFLAPYTGGTIFGIGLNYRQTILEMGFPLPTEPYLFPKLANSVTGPDAPVVADPGVSREVDWEGELAVIIGRRASKVPAVEALDHVWGYTAANDVSARDVQRADPQWVRGKGLDTFCPLGPVAVTRDGIPDPQDVRIRTWIDGELVQDGNTSDMLFRVPALIEYLSTHFTLQPGDIILTGTPSGCGGFMDPPRFVQPGSNMRVEVSGVGTLHNPVVARL